MDSFIENNDTADYESETPSLIEKSAENNMEQDESIGREEEQFIFRHVEKIYDSLLEEIRNDCDAEWTTKFRKAQSTYLCGSQYVNSIVAGSNTGLYKRFDRC